MGTFTYAAGVSRPPELRPFPAARENLRASENRFNDYLEEARAPKPKPEREVDRAEDARENDQTEAAEPEANDETTPKVDDTEPTTAGSVTTEVVGDANLTATLTLDGTAQSADTETATTDVKADAQADVAASQIGARSTNQSNTTQNAQTFQNNQTGTDATSTTDEAPATRQQATQPSLTGQGLQQLNTTTQTAAATQAAENKASQQRADGKQAVANTDTRPTRETSDGAIQRGEVNQPRTEARNAQTNQPIRENSNATQPQLSLFDQKIAAAKTAERLGQSEYIVPGAATDSSGPGRNPTQRVAPLGSPTATTVETNQAQSGVQADSNANVNGRLSKLLAEAVGSADDNTPKGTIKTARGDSAAVSTFRLLTDGAIEASRGQAGNQGASPAVDGVAAGTQSSATRGLNAPNNPGQLVGQLLNASVEKADGAEGLARLLNASSVPGRHQATLRLDPPELGQVNIRIDLKHEGLSLQVQAQSRDVARLLESRLTDLRDALATHGIRIERTDVVVQSNATADAQFNNAATDDEANATTFADSQESNAQRDSQDAERTGDDSRGAASNDDGEANQSDVGGIDSDNEHNEPSLLSETAVNLVA